MIFSWCKFYAHFNTLLKPLSSFRMQLLLAMLMWYDGICVDPLLRIHTLITHTLLNMFIQMIEKVEEPNFSPHIYEKGGAKNTITWILKNNYNTIGIMTFVETHFNSFYDT